MRTEGTAGHEERRLAELAIRRRSNAACRAGRVREKPSSTTLGGGQYVRL